MANDNQSFGFSRRLLKKRGDDLVGTTMFTAFLLSSSGSRVPFHQRCPAGKLPYGYITVLKSLRAKPPAARPWHRTPALWRKIFLEKCRKLDTTNTTNQPALLWNLKSPYLHHNSDRTPKYFVQGAKKIARNL